MKEDYIRHVIEAYALGGDFDALLGDQWIDSSQLDEAMELASNRAFAEYGIDAAGKYFGQASALFGTLLQRGAILQEGDEYTGFWFRLRAPTKVKVLTELREGNPATLRVRALGEEALRRALLKIANDDGLGAIDGSKSDQIASEMIEALVPASDRLVRLNHNQQHEISGALEEVITLVDKENSIDGEVGLRELVLGRLRAGRELIQAGIFSMQSLHLTLIVGLRMLVEKYGELAIGVVAGNLLDLLLQQYGIG